MDIVELISTWVQHEEALIGFLVVLSAFFWLGTLIVVPMIIIALPADYLTRKETVFPAGSPSSLWQYPYLILKNIFGTLFIIAGLAMLVLPGQGLLTLALGLGLVSFPGKHRVIQRILGHRRILRGINRLRVRAKKPPLSVHPPRH